MAGWPKKILQLFVCNLHSFLPLFLLFFPSRPHWADRDVVDLRPSPTGHCVAVLVYTTLSADCLSLLLSLPAHILQTTGFNWSFNKPPSQENLLEFGVIQKPVQDCGMVDSRFQSEASYLRGFISSLLQSDGENQRGFGQPSQIRASVFIHCRLR